MATSSERGRCHKCCSETCSYFVLLTKKSIPVVIIQLIGWALFSYVEDDLNVIDCFARPQKVAEMMFPPSNEEQRAGVLFNKLYNKTGQELTVNQSIEMYHLFRAYFKMPAYGLNISDGIKTYIACVKWFRFASLTLTTIGFGVVTPKSSLGRLLTIPYALLSMPVVLSYLALVGSLISKFVEWIMMHVHRCIKGDKPLRYKHVKRCIYLFILFWLFSLLAVNSYVYNPLMFQSSGAMRWLDGLYFIFVTYTTVGFGDITGPAYDVSFYTNWFFPGLALASGLIDSIVSLIDTFNFSSRTDGVSCCCITCNQEDTMTSGEINDSSGQI